MFNKKCEQPDVSSDMDRIGPNVFYNNELARWDTIDHDKDTIVIDIVGNYDEEGYVSIKRAPATTGEPAFEEILRINLSDGVRLFKGQFQEVE